MDQTSLWIPFINTFEQYKWTLMGILWCKFQNITLLPLTSIMYFWLSLCCYTNVLGSRDPRYIWAKNSLFTTDLNMPLAPGFGWITGVLRWNSRNKDLPNVPTGLNKRWTKMLWCFSLELWVQNVYFRNYFCIQTLTLYSYCLHLIFTN